MTKICIVDDDETIRNFLVLTLKESGYETVDYECAKDFMSNCDCEHFDLIISDIVMDEIDGVALLQFIKERIPNLPVIMISAEGGYEDNNGVNINLIQGMLKEMGAVTLMHKPIDAHRLIDYIKSILK